MASKIKIAAKSSFDDGNIDDESSVESISNKESENEEISDNDGSGSEDDVPDEESGSDDDNVQSNDVSDQESGNEDDNNVESIDVSYKESGSDVPDIESGSDADNDVPDKESGSDADNDKESGGSDDDSTSDKEETEGLDANLGWADSIAKILKTKKPKSKRTLVLSKAKKLSDVVLKVQPDEAGFEIDGEIKDEGIKKKPVESYEPPRKKIKELPTYRIKPDILDKGRERLLAQIATRGVVQLFNSVKMQQKDIDAKLEEAGPLERKRENVMKSIDKRAFLDVLMKKKSQPVDENVKDEVKDESNKATWNVLREDFMMGAKLKDWDKNAEDDENDQVDSD